MRSSDRHAPFVEEFQASAPGFEPLAAGQGHPEFRGDVDALENEPTEPVASEVDEAARRLEQAIAATRTQYEEQSAREHQSWIEFRQALEESLTQQQQQLADVLARRAVELAMTAAQRVVRRELRSDPDAVERLIRDVLWRLAESRPLRVRLNPEDAQRLRSGGDLDALGIQEVVEDRRIGQGGCILESDDRSWDATVNAQLERLASAVEQKLGDEE